MTMFVGLCITIDLYPSFLSKPQCASALIDKLPDLTRLKTDSDVLLTSIDDNNNYKIKNPSLEQFSKSLKLQKNIIEDFDTCKKNINLKFSSHNKTYTIPLKTLDTTRIQKDIYGLLYKNEQKILETDLFFKTAIYLRQANLLQKVDALYVSGTVGLGAAVVGLSNLSSGNVKDTVVETAKIGAIMGLVWYVTSYIAKEWNPLINAIDSVGTASDVEKRLKKDIEDVNFNTNMLYQEIKSYEIMSEIERTNIQLEKLTESFKQASESFNAFTKKNEDHFLDVNKKLDANQQDLHQITQGIMLTAQQNKQIYDLLKNQNSSSALYLQDFAQTNDSSKLLTDKQTTSFFGSWFEKQSAK